MYAEYDMTIPPPPQSYAGVITLRLSLGALCTFLTLLNREKKIIYDLLFSYVFFSLSLSFSFDGIEEEDQHSSCTGDFQFWSETSARLPPVCRKTLR